MVMWHTTSTNGVTTQKTNIDMFKAVRTSNLTYSLHDATPRKPQSTGFSLINTIITPLETRDTKSDSCSVHAEWWNSYFHQQAKEACQSPKFLFLTQYNQNESQNTIPLATVQHKYISPSGQLSNTVCAMSPAESLGLNRNSFVFPLTRINRRLI